MLGACLSQSCSSASCGTTALAALVAKKATDAAQLHRMRPLIMLCISGMCQSPHRVV